MRNLLGIIFILLAFVAFSNAPPGELPVTFDMEQVAVINDVDNTTIDLDSKPIMSVREVTCSVPWSNRATVNESRNTNNKTGLTEKAISFHTDVELTLKKPPAIDIYSWGYNDIRSEKYRINHQKCNYGYPLSADEQ